MCSRSIFFCTRDLMGNAQSSVVSRQPSAISRQPSAISHQSSVTQNDTSSAECGSRLWQNCATEEHQGHQRVLTFRPSSILQLLNHLHNQHFRRGRKKGGANRTNGTGIAMKGKRQRW
jgi:hypothetical protein